MLYRFICHFFLIQKQSYQHLPKRILILRFSSIGDIVLITPAIEAIATNWPKAEIFVATKKAMSPLLSHNPYVTGVVSLEAGEGMLHYACRLLKYKPSIVLDFHNKLRSKLIRCLLLFAGGVPGVVWKQRSVWDYFPLPVSWKNFQSRVLFSDRYHATVERLAKKKLSRGFLRYHVSENERKEAYELLEKVSIKIDQPLIAMVPGTSWQTKQWPIEYFIQLIADVQKKKLQVLLLGSEAETPLIQSIQKEFPSVPDFCGVPLRLAGACISYCRVLVSNDSGPMHIARGLGVPTLAIFGSTDPKMFDFTHHFVGYSYQACSPCGFNGRPACPKKHFRCMWEYTPEMACKDLELLLLGPSHVAFSHG